MIFHIKMRSRSSVCSVAGAPFSVPWTLAGAPFSVLLFNFLEQYADVNLSTCSGLPTLKPQGGRLRKRSQKLQKRDSKKCWQKAVKQFESEDTRQIPTITIKIFMHMQPSIHLPLPPEADDLWQKHSALGVAAGSPQRSDNLTRATINWRADLSQVQGLGRDPDGTQKRRLWRRHTMRSRTICEKRSWIWMKRHREMPQNHYRERLQKPQE